MNKDNNKKDYSKQELANKYHFVTPDYIEDYEDFRSLFQICEEANENDQIHIDINCRGGRIDLSKMLYNALCSTKAHVSTSNKSSALSGGSIILLAGDSISIDRFAETYIHSSHYATGWDTNKEHKVQSDLADRSVETFYKEVYAGFLTDKEIDDVLKGEPIAIHDEEHIDRLKSLFDYREKVQEDYIKEVKKEQMTRESLKKKTKEELVDIILPDTKG